MSRSVEPVNLADYEELARQRVEPGAWGYLAGGADDEATLRDNVAAYQRLRLVPRVLVDVSSVDPATTVLGQRVAFPVLLAPTAFQTLVHPEGERASARAAAAAGTIAVVSTMSGYRLEDVAAAAPGPKWFQLYCYRERDVTRRFVERAEAAGYSAICLTVDLPRVGNRERDIRNRFFLPPTVRPRNFEELVGVDVESRGNEVFFQYIQRLIDPSLTWEAVQWLRSITRLPVLLKGILAAADARRAVEHGVAGIVVSNHGGRQLDGVPATIDALPEIAAAVGGRAELLVDGGVRRGTDVLKALALGARAVLIGRPYVHGLAADGEPGVRRVLEILQTEFELALALAGCPSARDVPSDLVWR
ncbi:MAG: alpha-hydroxy-acid oxidizing enzyme [Gemmatimonadetes bacterium RIFCSPLOWO2_12_FULL_68_9]|nr:MAG: alpha-hydroxy-acid oxidizing enzyme [Gemmatimonadetes bacterium RIFCSPLOWO2_12_FULL_68_9]